MALTDSIVAYWKLDEASGTRYDSVGSSHLTDYSTVPSGTGKIGTGVVLPGATANEYLYCASNSALEMGDIDFCMCGWYQKTGSTYYATVGKFNSNSTGDYILEPNTYNGCKFGVIGSNLQPVLATDNYAITMNEWVFLFGWHDSVANQIGLQVNDRTPVVVSHTLGVAITSTQFMVGAYSDTQYPSQSMSIDEIGIWKRVLTSDERAALYNSGAGLTYPFSSTAAIPVFMNQYRQRRS